MNPFVLSSLKTKDAEIGTQYYLSGFQPADMAIDLSQYTDFSKSGAADEILASWNVASGWEGIATYNPPNETQDEADGSIGKKRNFTAPSTLSRAVRGGMSGSPIVRRGSMHVVGVLVENLADIDRSTITDIRAQCRTLVLGESVPNGTVSRARNKKEERIAINDCTNRGVRKLENSYNAYFFGLEPMDFLQRILDARIDPSSEEALHKIREASNTQSRLLDPNIAEINQQFLEPVTNHMFEIDRNAELVLNIGRSIPIRTFGTTPSAKRNKAAFVAMYCRLSPISRRFIFDLIKSRPPNDAIRDSLINEVVTVNQCP
ncbi:MAG: hypothetical protein CFE32_15390 [Alphaproteobacteria bacterium PA3]|nr:MAG: hypothetical protein CFE32_15390 [Alphaproteobacteria bacterium PA3]